MTKFVFLSQTYQICFRHATTGKYDSDEVEAEIKRMFPSATQEEIQAAQMQAEDRLIENGLLWL